MFIVGENPDIMLCVSGGENNPKFPMELQEPKYLLKDVLPESLILKNPWK